MARNAPLLPRPRRGARTVPPPPDDLAVVHGWLCRLGAGPAEIEQLLVDVLRRSLGAPPACVAGASPTTRLQFLTVSSVLRQRGVI